MRPPNANRLAAKAVALHYPGTPAERREVLAMLGLLDDTGRAVRPDNLIEQLPISPLKLGGSTDPREGGLTVHEPRPRNCTTPPGLLNLPPGALRRAPTKAPVTNLCGTMSGVQQHRRRREPPCRECKDARNVYQRQFREGKKAARQALKPPPVKRPAKPAKRRGPKPGPNAIKANPNLPPRPETCGTLAGRSNHKRRGQPLCPPCAEAYRDHQRELKRRQRAAARDDEKRSA